MGTLWISLFELSEKVTNFQSGQHQRKITKDVEIINILKTTSICPHRRCNEKSRKFNIRVARLVRIMETIIYAFLWNKEKGEIHTK